MTTQFTLPRKKILGSFGVIMTFMMATIAIAPLNAQTANTTSTMLSQNERMVKGLISDANGPLENASVILKGTKVGTTTNSKGEFSFPQPLKTGDILLISYLGYQTEQAQIKEDTTFLSLTLTEELIEFVGALNSDKPYKSKRSHKE